MVDSEVLARLLDRLRVEQKKLAEFGLLNDNDILNNE